MTTAAGRTATVGVAIGDSNWAAVRGSLVAEGAGAALDVGVVASARLWGSCVSGAGAVDLARSLKTAIHNPGSSLVAGTPMGLGVGVADAVAVGCAVGVAVLDGASASVGVALGVCVGMLVSVHVGVGVAVLVGVSVAVSVGVAVVVAVGVWVAVGVTVAVAVSVYVAVDVAEGVAVAVGEGVALAVTVDVAVGDGVAVSAAVSASVDVRVGLGVGDGSGGAVVLAATPGLGVGFAVCQADDVPLAAVTAGNKRSAWSYAPVSYSMPPPLGAPSRPAAGSSAPCSTVEGDRGRGVSTSTSSVAAGGSSCDTSKRSPSGAHV